MASQLNRREFMKAGMASLPLIAMQMSTPGRAVIKQFSAANAVEKPNVLILVFDTLSAPHMSLFGYERETTPQIARFAETANVYHNHYAGGNFTSPGTASLLTGTYPWTHRALHLQSTVLDELAPRNLFAAFDDSYFKIAYTHNLLVAALLSQFRHSIDHWKMTRDLCLSDSQYSDRLFPNDYNAAFLAEWQNLRGSKTPGSLALSFVDRIRRFLIKRSLTDEYGALFPRGIPNLHSLHFVLEDVIDWLIVELANLPQPFLAYVHVLPPHEPYLARRDFVDAFAGHRLRIDEKPRHFAEEGHDQTLLNQQRLLYDEYMAYADAEFGRFFDHLRQDSLFDKTVMVVTSDHGELFERGIRGHVTPALYQPITHVPLLIRHPGQSTRTDIYTATSCVDLVPTLMAATDQAVPSWCEGAELPGLSAVENKSERPIFTVEAKSNPKLAPLDTATIAMVKGDYKLINNRGYEGRTDDYELYNLAQDPEEMNDLYPQQVKVAGALMEEMESSMAQAHSPG